MKTSFEKMCTNQLLPLRLFPNWSQLCNTKLCSFSIKRQALTSSRISSATLARITSCPGSYMWQQCFHPWKSKQSKLAWLKSASYSSAITDTEQNSECNQKEPAHKNRKDLMANSIRRERLQSRSLIQEIVAKQADSTWTDGDWANLAENLRSLGKDMWEVACMHTFYVDKNISVARRLMTYLESQEQPPSLIVLIFYIGLLGETSSGSEDQGNETYKYYQLLLSRTDILDAASIEVLISGLSMTKYYRECVNLLRICRETSTPNSSNLVKLLRASLRNKDTDICQLALTAFEENAEPTAFNAYVPQVVEECLAVNNQDGLDMVMNFIQKHRLLIQKKALEEVTEIFHRYQPNQWTANYGHIHQRSGHCTVCGHQMMRFEMHDDDFRSIQSVFLDQVIVGRNVFFKSSPDEVDMFVKYVQKWGPFDVVIDGLNTLYRGHQKPNLQQLLKVVEYFTSQEKKILILGSRMLSSYITNMKTLVPRPSTYLTSTTKADDAFFLYAALHSGKNTLIVTSDKLRDHKFLLEPSLRPIFYQWLLSAQVYDWHITKSGVFRMGNRHIYVNGPAKDDDGWHIPEMDIDFANPFGKFSVLCLRSKIKQNVSHQVDRAANKTYNKNLTQKVSTESDVGQVRPRVKQKQENLAILNNSKTGKMGMSRTAERKLQQSNNKSKSDKEWFDN